MQNRLGIWLAVVFVALAAYLGSTSYNVASDSSNIDEQQNLTTEITGWLQNYNFGHAIQDVHVIAYQEIHGKDFDQVRNVV